MTNILFWYVVPVLTIVQMIIPKKHTNDVKKTQNYELLCLTQAQIT